MKFNAYFQDGPLVGKLATLEVPEFRIGDTFELMGYHYRAADGPAARLCQETQAGHDHLGVSMLYLGRAPLDEELDAIRREDQAEETRAIINEEESPAEDDNDALSAEDQEAFDHALSKND